MMIISNATPLIAFARIRQLALLQAVTQGVVIPQAVADEIASYSGSPFYGSIDVAQESWITVRSVQSDAHIRLLLPTLDRGEAEVIALALAYHPGMILMDELTGRKVAESLCLPIVGSAGILLRAKQMGIITHVKPFLDDMLRCGIRYSQRFIDTLLQQIGEAP